MSSQPNNNIPPQHPLDDEHQETVVIDKTVVDFSDDDDEDDDAELAAEQYQIEDEDAEHDGAEGDNGFMDDEMFQVLNADDINPIAMDEDEDGEGDEEEEEHQYDETIIDNAAQTFKLHKDSVFSIAFDKKEQLLITGGGDDKAVVYDLTKNEAIHTLSDFQDSIVKTIYSPVYTDLEGYVEPQQFLAVAAMDGAIKIYDAATIAGLKNDNLGGANGAEVFCEFHTEQDLDTIVFHPTQALLTAGCADGQVWLFDLLTQTPKILFGHNDSITTLFFTNDHKSLVSSSQDGQVIIHNIDPNVKKDAVKYDKIGTSASPVITVAQHPLTTAMCIGTIEGTLATGQVDHWKLQIAKDNAHGDSIEAIKFLRVNPRTVWVFTSSVDGTLTAWDYTTMSPRYTIQLPYAVTLFQFHPTMPLLCVASHDGILRVYDLTTGAHIHDFTGHQDAILDLIVDEKFLYTSSDDRSVKQWAIADLPADKLADIVEKQKKEQQDQQQQQQNRVVNKPGQVNVVGARTRPAVSRPVVAKPQPKAE